MTRPTHPPMMPVVDPNAGAAPAVTQAPPPEEKGFFRALFDDPARMQMVFSGLGMALAPTQQQQMQFQGQLNQSLLDQARHKRTEPERKRRQEAHDMNMEINERTLGAVDQYNDLVARYNAGEVTMEQYALELMSIPGYESAGATILGKIQTNAGGFIGPDGTQWKDRKEYEQARQAAMSDVDPLAEEIATARGNFEAIVASSQVPDGVGRGAADQAMVISFAKMLDPTSVVRTEEGEQIARTDGYFGALQGFLKQIEGRGSLSAGGRQGLVEEAYRQLQAKNMPIYERLVAKNQVGSPLFGDLASPDTLGFSDWVTGYEMPTYFGEGPPPTTDSATTTVPALLDPNAQPYTPDNPPPIVDGLFPWENQQ